MEYSRQDLVIGTKVKIKKEAKFIMKDKEQNWDDSMESYLGETVEITRLLDTAFTIQVDNISKNSLMNLFLKNNEIIWTYECIEEIIELPQISDQITLEELLSLATSWDQILKILRSVKTHEGISLSKNMFHMDLLEQQLSTEILQILHENGYQKIISDEEKIIQYEKEILRLKNKRKE